MNNRNKLNPKQKEEYKGVRKRKMSHSKSTTTFSVSFLSDITVIKNHKFHNQIPKIHLYIHKIIFLPYLILIYIFYLKSMINLKLTILLVLAVTTYTANIITFD